MLIRIDPGDPGTVATLEAAGRAVTELGRALLYPHDGDVAAAVDAACALVRDSALRP